MRVARFALTDREGKARFEKVDPGKYSAKVDQLGAAGWDSAFIEVGADLADKSIDLRWPSSRILSASVLRGAILDSNSAHPIADGSLQLVEAISGALMARSLTNDDGMFDLGSPNPGLYFIKFDSPHQADWEPQGSIPVLVKTGLQRRLTIFVGQTSCGLMHSELCVAPKITSRRVDGKVTDTSGGVINRAKIQLLTLNSNGEKGGKSTSTGADGHFAFRDVAPGEYKLLISATGFGPALVPITLDSGGAANAGLNISLGILGGACPVASTNETERRSD
jgi:hypothetical protein